MKKYIFIMLVSILSMTAYSQNNKVHKIPEIANELTLYYKSNWGQHIGIYDVTRIGEHYWFKRNLTHKKTRLENVSWQPIQEVNNVTPDNFKNYFKNLQLDINQWLPKVNADTFTYYYGVYYHEHSIRGYWSGAGNHLYPIEGVFNEALYADNTWQKRLPQDPDEKYRWGMPTNNDFRQLFAMVPLLGGEREKESNKRVNRELNVYDVRINLAPKLGSTPVAFDIHSPTGSWNKTYWFETGQGLFDFNMYPGGGRVDRHKYFEMEGLDPFNAYWGDFYQLFYVSKFATKDGSLDIEDFIHFYPNEHENLAMDNGTWYNVRFQRPLKVEELGYRLFYNDDEDNPDIKEIWYDDIATGEDLTKDSDVMQYVPDGYTELEKGYLRGFYVTYRLNKMEDDILYSMAELVQLSKCVSEYKAEPDCDCRQGLVPNILNNLRLQNRDKGDVAINIGEEFNIYAESSISNPKDLKFKLITDAVEPDFYELDVTYIGSFTYKIKIPNMPDLIKGDYILQPYVKMPIVATVKDEKTGAIILDSKGYPITKVMNVDISINRPNDEDKSHIVDNLTLYINSPYTRSMSRASNQEILTNHLSIQDFTSKPISLEGRRVFKIGDQIAVTIPHTKSSDSEKIKLGIFNQTAGDFMIDMTKVRATTNRQIIVFEVTDNVKFTDRLRTGLNALILAAYIEDDAGVKKKISRPYIKNLDDRLVNPFRDRELIYIDYDPYGEDEWDFFSATIEELSIEELSIKISPNPVSDYFEVQGNFEELKKVEIHSIAGGGLVKSETKNLDKIYVGNLPMGSYVVSVTTDKGVASANILKK